MPKKQIAADLVLIILSLLATLFFAGAPTGARIFATIVIPTLYIILAKVLASVPISEGAGRAYFLCFMSGAFGLLHLAMSIFSTLRWAQGDDKLLSNLCYTIEAELPGCVIPLCIGVATLVLTSAMARSSVASNSVSVESNGLVKNIGELTQIVGALVEKCKTLDSSLTKLDLATRNGNAGLKSAVSEAHDVLNEFAKLVAHPAINKK